MSFINTSREISVGQMYKNKAALQHVVKSIAIAHNFEFEVIKSDRRRYTMACSDSDKGCSWCLHAAKELDCMTFTIWTISSEHNCVGVQHQGHKQGDVTWIGTSIMGKLNDIPTYKPLELKKDLQREKGFTMGYQQAWRAKEKAMKMLSGSREEGYRLLPRYCEELKLTNPGSHIDFQEDHGRFTRVFVAFHASLLGFCFCRPILGIDGTHLKGKYLGTLLVATGIDAEGALFILAFAIVDAENDNNWLWFLSRLKAAMYSSRTIRDIKFLSDRQKGVVEGGGNYVPRIGARVLSEALADNFRRIYKNPALTKLLWKAAYALTEVDFGALVLKIEKISKDARVWVQNSEPIFWANCLFRGRRYGHYTSNIAESLNAWILEARELPILQLIKNIHRKTMECFYNRRLGAAQAEEALSSYAQKMLNKSKKVAQSYQIIPSAQGIYECILQTGAKTVSTGERKCTCKRWQTFGIPCAHVVSALLFQQLPLVDFVEDFYTSSFLRQTYEGCIFPVTDVQEWTNIKCPTLLLPITCRPLGRPKKKRIRTEDIGREKHRFKCSRCGMAGHSRLTCRNALP